MTHRIEIIVEDGQHALLEERAARTGRSVGVLVQEIVAAHLAAEDPLSAASSLFEDTLSGDAHDEALYRTPDGR